MRSTSGTKLLLLVFIIMLTSCAPASAAKATDPVVQSPTKTLPATDLPKATTSPEPQATASAEPTKTQHTFTASTYKDDKNGFELTYPSTWTLVPDTQIGSRGSAAQILSPGSTAEKLADGGTRVGITIYQWDPKNDLDAYAAHRKTAWDGGGSTIIAQTSGTLVDGRKEMSFTVQGPDKQPAFFMLTSMGENYLEIAGDGNLALIEEIAKTVQPLNYKP